MTVKCICGRENCLGQIRIVNNHDNALLFFTNDILNGDERSIYMDANSLVALIKEARKVLISLTQEDNL